MAGFTLDPIRQALCPYDQDMCYAPFNCDGCTLGAFNVPCGSCPVCGALPLDLPGVPIGIAIGCRFDKYSCGTEIGLCCHGDASPRCLSVTTLVVSDSCRINSDVIPSEDYI